MIPVNPLAMVVGYIILIFSEVFLWLLIACLVAFLIPRCRRYMLARRWRFGFLVVGLAVVSAPYVKIVVGHWLDVRAHTPRLQHEEVLGDLVLPAGTQVRLENLQPFDNLAGEPVPFGMQSLKHADFDRTLGNIMGMRVRRLELWQSHGTATVETVSTHDLEGWTCEPGKVEFNFPFGAHFTFSQWSLQECMLAPGTRLGGIIWPGPVRVFSTERGWEARSEDTPVQLLGMELRGLRMRLNRPGSDVFMWQGALDRAVDFGSVHYPQGTQVRSDQGNLLFSLPPDM